MSKAKDTRIRVGVDTGGTFTDLVVLENERIRQAKVLSTPDDPARAIRQGIEKMGLADVPLDVVHGSTVATNAILEGRGGRVVFMTSQGFRDILTLGRQNRRNVYELAQPEQPPPVPRDHCLEVSTRITASGRVARSASDDELRSLKRAVAALQPDAVAISLLFSWLAPEEERRIADALEGPWQVCCSSDVWPEEGEYERSIATWMNAAVGPLMGSYLDRLGDTLPRARIAVMQSDGLTLEAGQAARHAARLLLSGPAGGLAAVEHLAKQLGQPRMMSFDMGGTSTDVALVDGQIPLSDETRVGPWPIPLPSVDLHTIGAGGGSIARIDEGGMLLVGPQSSGADPGPACYGQGGTEPTVTDANVVLGRIPATARLGGDLPIDVNAARSAVGRLAEQLGCDLLTAAGGIIRIANEHMARALRVISVERGEDPRGHPLVCFGGAGGLHACELAELLGMDHVVVPASAGVLSALGMLASAPGRIRSQAWGSLMRDIDHAEIESRCSDLEAAAMTELQSEGVDPSTVESVREALLRYAGQGVGLTVAVGTPASMADEFDARHEARYGHRLEADVELASLRVILRAPPPLGTTFHAEMSDEGPVPAKERETATAESACEVALIDRKDLSSGDPVVGPAVIVEAVATTWVAPGWKVEPDAAGHLHLSLR